jgi:hypothetical protein
VGGNNLNKKTTMKNDTVLKLIPGVIAIGGVTYLALTHVSASYFSDGAVALGYAAVVALVVIAGLDYRGRSRSYVSR